MTIMNLSIIVVLWNNEKYIQKFLDDLIMSLNTFNNWEILFYDNASTDSTVEIVSNNIEKSL